MDFFSAVSSLLFSLEGRIPEGTELILLVFASGAAFMGLVVVILDWGAHTLTGGRSYLHLSYGGWKTPWMLLIWGIGAGIGGFIGAAANVLEIQRAACLTAGISWPLILPRIIAAAEQEEVEQGGEE